MIPENQTLFVFYPSYDAFKATYEREIPYFTMILNLVEDHPEIETQKILSPEAPTEEEIEAKTYCTLKYQTNNTAILRQFYRYIFRLGQMLGMQHELEEVENGFLLFYKRPLDFELSILDYFQLGDVLKFLQKKNLVTSQTQPYVEQLINLLQPIMTLETTPEPTPTNKTTIKKRSSRNQSK